MNVATEYRSVIIKAFPELADAAFSVMPTGWDCAAVDVNDALVFKFPRSAEAETRLRKEARLLQVVKPNISMHVPALRLHDGPPLFSSHCKIKGGHLLTDEYRGLTAAQRSDLADGMAQFYADLHGLSLKRMAQAGAAAIAPWPEAGRLRAAAKALLPDHLQDFARETLDMWENLGSDPPRRHLWIFRWARLEHGF